MSFRTVFLPFYSPNNPKNQNFQKMKQKSGDTIILHMCVINDNHMMYGYWNIKRNGHNFLSFWTFFLPFCLPNNLKNFWKTEKTTWRYYYIILHMCTMNDKHMMYCSSDIKCDGCNCYFSFRTIFCCFTP